VTVTELAVSQDDDSTSRSAPHVRSRAVDLLHVEELRDDTYAWALHSYRRRGRRSRCRGRPRTVSGQRPSPSSAAGTRGSARATPAPRRRRAAARRRRHRCPPWSSGQQTKVRSWTRTPPGGVRARVWWLCPGGSGAWERQDMLLGQRGADQMEFNRR
jgi:hypothetical protein